MRNNLVRLTMVGVVLAVAVCCGCSKPMPPVTEIHVAGMPLDITSEIFSRLHAPVAPDAVVQVPGKQASIIVNVFSADEGGNVKAGAVPEVIMASDTDHFRLDKTMSKRKLASGSYLMNIVFGGKTERVVFTVK
jgi:hypothetical protein